MPEMNDAVIAQVRSRIEKYRRGRHPRSPLPPELWAEATAVAAEMGVYAASRRLGVSYESLRARLDAAGDAPRRDDRPVFVELEGTTPWPPVTSGDVVEVVDSSGAKLTIRLGNGDVDVASIVRAFREERA
jgi:hypothetical protein